MPPVQVAWAFIQWLPALLRLVKDVKERQVTPVVFIRFIFRNHGFTQQVGSEGHAECPQPLQNGNRLFRPAAENELPGHGGKVLGKALREHFRGKRAR